MNIQWMLSTLKLGAYYHVNVRLSDNETLEALARVLDTLEVNITPLLVESALKEGNE